jgi:hypothetical protein
MNNAKKFFVEKKRSLFLVMKGETIILRKIVSKSRGVQPKEQKTYRGDSFSFTKDINNNLCLILKNKNKNVKKILNVIGVYKKTRPYRINY